MSNIERLTSNWRLNLFATRPGEQKDAKEAKKTPCQRFFAPFAIFCLAQLERKTFGDQRSILDVLTTTS